MHLGHLVGYGTEGRHRSEGHTLEVHVKSGHDDADTMIGQGVAHLDDAVVEELCLVDANHVDVVGQQQDASRRVDRRRLNMLLVVAHHVFLRIAHIDGGFENLHPLLGELGASHSAYQFLRFAREHRAAHYFYSSWAVCLAC